MARTLLAWSVQHPGTGQDRKEHHPQPRLQWQRQDRSKSSLQWGCRKVSARSPGQGQGSEKAGQGVQKETEWLYGGLLTRKQSVLLFLQSHSGHLWERLLNERDRMSSTCVGPTVPRGAGHPSSHGSLHRPQVSQHHSAQGRPIWKHHAGVLRPNSVKEAF